MTIKVKVNNTWRTVADAKPPRLGDAFGGGIYIGKYDEEFYLVAANINYHVNQPTVTNNTNAFEKKVLMPWCTSNAYYSTGASDSNNGQFNAQMVDTYVNNNSRGLTYSNFPAFNYIKNYMNAGTGVGGYTDWYLPSFQELLFIFANGEWFHKYYNNPIVYFPTLAAGGYWSSTEYSSTVGYDTPYYLEAYNNRWYWYRFGYYYEYYLNYYYSRIGITSYKTRNQGILPIRRVDIL